MFWIRLVEGFVMSMNDSRPLRSLPPFKFYGQNVMVRSVLCTVFLSRICSECAYRRMGMNAHFRIFKINSCRNSTIDDTTDRLRSCHRHDS
jgi:hypothetical protein